jgi:hypothetical protein
VAGAFHTDSVLPIEIRLYPLIETFEACLIIGEKEWDIDPFTGTVIEHRSTVPGLTDIDSNVNHK